MSKDKDYIRLIHDRRWLRLRRQRLTLHPVCEMCEKEGRVTAAVEVHHIVPVETGLTFRQKAELMFSPSNVMALCHECHVRVHTEMGRSGKAATKRINALKICEFEKKFLT